MSEFIQRAGELHEHHQPWTPEQREYVGEVLHHVNRLENR